MFIHTYLIIGFCYFRLHQIKSGPSIFDHDKEIVVFNARLQNTTFASENESFSASDSEQKIVRECK